jgi:hypothetical protein
MNELFVPTESGTAIDCLTVAWLLAPIWDVKALLNCEAGHYYLINNSNPDYNANGTLSGSVPPSSLRSIGDALNEQKITWAWFAQA